MAQNVAYVRISEGGRIVIPATFRKALGMKPGDKLTLELCDGELHVRTLAEGIRRAQTMLGPYLAGAPSLVDELIAERRAEAANE